jgi:CRP/FNR family cyclic AMP-dependent transcriptional regulator
VGVFAQEPLLSALRPADRAAFLAAGTRRHYEPGQTLMHQGALEDFVLAVTSGWAVIRVEAANGRSLIFTLSGPEDLIGELAALDGRPRSATVAALTPLDAYLLPRLTFHRFLREYPQVNVAVLKSMALRLRSSDDHRQDLATLPVLQRLARLLISLDEPGPKAEVAGRLTQQELATAIGATRESVAKALAGLRARNVLSTADRQVRVIDRVALSAIAEL